MTTFKWWIGRSRELEKERNEWRDIAYRLTTPYHDKNCEYAAECSYCQAMKKASDR